MPPITGRSDNGKPQSASSESSGPISPYWATSDGETVRLYLGEVRGVLARLPARSVQCVVTSPPYWGLRDYGTGFWEGGDPECDHKRPSQSPLKHVGSDGKLGTNNTNWDHRHEIGYKGKCGKCGAIQVDSQIGSESSPDCGTNGQAQCGGCFVCTMVAVFRGVRRVLRDDGVLWLNLGDSYGDMSGSGFDSNGDGGLRKKEVVGKKYVTGLGKGNLVGVPWRVALALQADGWILRQDVIWAKPAPMPESVTNRCTKAHEYVFLLTKGEGYYCDMEAIKERPTEELVRRVEKERAKSRTRHAYKQEEAVQMTATDTSNPSPNGAWHDPEKPDRLLKGSNKRSVWTVSSSGYPGAHFATFPSKLIEPMILAGTSEKGACTVCGAPWERVAEKLGPVGGRQHGRKGGGDNPYNAEDQWGLDEGGAGANWPVKTTGWAPGCRCGSESVRPCVVLDPFVGSGTTVVVANDHGRWGWGIDLSEEYLRNHAIKRVEGALLRRPATSGLTGRVRQPVTGLGRAIKTL